MRWQIPKEEGWPDVVFDHSKLQARDLDRRKHWALVVPPARRMALEPAHYPALCEEWRSFVLGLHMCGVQIVCAENDARQPDGVYIGDNARHYRDVVVIGAMDSPARRQETQSVERLLKRLLDPEKLFSIAEIDPGAKLQHGDAVIIGDTVFLGISKHTDCRGARALAKTLKPFGWRIEPVAFDPRKVSHLTTAVSEVPDGVVANPDWVDIAPFVKAGLWVIEVPEQEPQAAGVFWVRTSSDWIFVPQHHRRTLDLLDDLGHKVVPCPLERFLDYNGVPGALCLFFATPC
jgi:dimethylargininase